MFKVRHKVSNTVHEVYDIQYDDCGYPHFLIYENNAWARVDAEHYKPCKLNALNEDYYKDKPDGECC